MSGCGDLEALISLLARRLVTLLPVSDRVSLVFVDPDGEWLRIHRVVPAVARSGALPRVRVEGTPVGQVACEGVARVVADVRADPQITFGHASHDGIRSTISVPVMIGGRVVGALNAGSRAVGACTEAMIPRMAAIAAIVGPAVFAAEQVDSPVARPIGEVGSPARPTDLIGSSAAFERLFAAARQTARSDADVLITGETGVGKTALARAIHGWSRRRSAPFVTVHLADLTPTLIESELFGHERGAFTGASAARVGRFESAHGGTILLDEIGEASPPVQSKLLRVIQDRCFERVGGGRTVEVDVRVIAATSRDLRRAIQRGELREDLFFRLSVVPLHVPPLRDRREDLEPLVRAILARIGASDGRARSLSPAAWARLRAHPWPGNIRELESALRRATILEESDELELESLAGLPEDDRPRPPEIAGPEETWPTLEQHERAYIERVLELKHGVIEGARGAARLLGVPCSTLRSRMKRLGISAHSTRASGRSQR